VEWRCTDVITAWRRAGNTNPSTQKGAGGRSSRERRPAERLRPPGSALLVAHSKGPGQGGGSAAATNNKGADKVVDVGKGGKNIIPAAASGRRGGGKNKSGGCGDMVKINLFLSSSPSAVTSDQVKNAKPNLPNQRLDKFFS
jgi:hypothetical protein